MSYDARAIANFYLELAHLKGHQMTNMVMQKTLFYAHGWHYKVMGTQLLNNTFEAWDYGPVIRVVYDTFKQYGKNPIIEKAKRFDPKANCYVNAECNLTTNERAFLELIYDTYAVQDAYKLSEDSHIEGGPWHTIRKSAEAEVCPGMKIPNELIKSYFTTDHSQTFQ